MVQVRDFAATAKVVFTLRRIFDLLRKRKNIITWDARHDDLYLEAITRAIIETTERLQP